MTIKLRRARRWLLLLALSLLGIVPTKAATPQVPSFAPCLVTVGNQTYAGPQNAHDASPAGSVLQFASSASCVSYSGQYGQVLKVTKSVILRGDPSAPATFDTDRFARSVVVEKPADGPRPQVTLENIVIQDSQAYGPQLGLTDGGGIYAINADITIRNSRFDSNRAAGKGGAIFLSGSTATISGSWFDRNDADYGASGIHLDSASRATIINSHFSNGFGPGSAVTLTNGSHVDIVNADMPNNPTGVGVSRSSANITHSSIRGNRLSYGVFVVDHSTVAITNTAVTSGFIGLVNRDSSVITATNLLLHGNDQPIEDRENRATLINPIYANPHLNADGSIANCASAARNAGIDAGVNTDILGNTRVDQPDIGAFELQDDCIPEPPEEELIFLPLVVR